ncbi:unnamed protein product [Wuchereria bancrofti]|nr:unnamed protein product [Wuchereria bancrofti]
MKIECYPETYAQYSSATEKYHKLKRVFGDVPTCLPSNRLCKLLYWTCRRIQFWFCFYNEGKFARFLQYITNAPNDMEMDVEDLLSNPFNTQPPSLNELIHVTGFSKDWIMFMYRNFKQICSNGRMPLQQWRRIFQLIFPKSANSEFADRVFRAIAGGKTSKHITFEELILCLHRISECYCIYASTSSQNSSAHLSRIAQFVFLLMKPNDHEQINLDDFKNYAEAVFSLNVPSMAYNSHHLFSQMHVSNNQYSHNNSCSSMPFQFPSNFRHYTLQCFNEMDTDNDGIISLGDVKRILTPECDSIRLFKEAHLLHS